MITRHIPFLMLHVLGLLLLLLLLSQLSEMVGQTKSEEREQEVDE